MLPDTGASKSLISLDQVLKCGFRIDSTRKSNIVAANGSNLSCEGSVKLRAFNPRTGRMGVLTALVSSDSHNPFLLSWTDMIKLGIISENFPFSQESNVNSIAEKISEKKKDEEEVLKFDEDNCPGLKELLYDFSDVVSNTLPDHPMVGPPMEIELKDNYVPFKLAVPRSISHHWRDEAKDLVRALQGKSILCRENGVTEFVSPAHFVRKPGGGLRMVVDFTKLNEAVKRPIHPFPSAHQCVQAIPPDAKFYAVCDMVQGYHQIPLSEKASKLTTIILWDGKYRWLRGPMGLNSTGDEWCFRSDELVHPFTDWCRKLVDDVVVWAPSIDTFQTF